MFAQQVLPVTNILGTYNFTVGFDENQTPVTKATPWVYRHECGKLFVKMSKICPVSFRATGML